MSPLHNYLDQIFREAKKYADKTMKSFDPEDIHKMRVALKKIKAAFYFEQFYLPQLGGEEMKESKKNFSDAGKIRELQLLQDAIKSFNSGDEIMKEKVLHELSREEKKAKKKFHDHFQDSGKNALNGLRKTMVYEAKKLTGADFKLYFQSRLEAMRIQIQTAQAEKDYHQLRKQLKELKYNLSFADEDSKRLVYAVFTEKELSQLEEDLGNWHDQVIITLWLKKLLSEKENKKQPLLQPFIDLVLKTSQQNSDQLLDAIHKRLPAK
jgi:CHAD domain-containing protein